MSSRKGQGGPKGKGPARRALPQQPLPQETTLEEDTANSEGAPTLPSVGEFERRPGIPPQALSQASDLTSAEAFNNMLLSRLGALVDCWRRHQLPVPSLVPENMPDCDSGVAVPSTSCVSSQPGQAVASLVSVGVTPQPVEQSTLSTGREHLGTPGPLGLSHLEGEPLVQEAPLGTTIVSDPQEAPVLQQLSNVVRGAAAEGSPVAQQVGTTASGAMDVQQGAPLVRQEAATGAVSVPQQPTQMSQPGTQQSISAATLSQPQSLVGSAILSPPLPSQHLAPQEL
nr:PREDICTED: uncharacterized protein LOC103280455 [Anolis carolinensis]|eukprot:XP_008117753.1 PREDICTED: uncharacterized protein LOC103280455 [Anolis carolinensis]